MSGKPIPEAVREARQIIDEFIQCAEVGRPHGKLIAQARDWLALTAAQQQGQAVAWMRRTATYRSVDGRSEGERIVSEQQVYPDDIPLYTAPPSAPVGVDEHSLRAARTAYFNCTGDVADAEGMNLALTAALRDIEANAQQPAAVDEAGCMHGCRCGGCSACKREHYETTRHSTCDYCATQHQEPTT